MIDWLTIVIALVIIATLIGFFGYLAMKINMSDPIIIGKKDENNQLVDSTNDKKKKEKNKRKDQKKVKRENKDEKVKEPSVQTSEETDDEQEESEQESSIAPQQTIESSKARKRNKNKTRTATPTRIEGNLKNDKNPNTTRAPPVTHPKSGSKDGNELTQQQGKSSQVSNKQTVPTTVASSSTTTKKTTQSFNTNQEAHKEQPFTTVGGNRHKTGTQQVQQQQNKSQVTSAPSVAPVQQSSSVNAQHDHLAQRQQLSQKETPAPFNGLTTNPLPLKQQVSAVPTKLADLVKALPSSQVVVTELMSALDAFPLSADELDIIMHKIANKQSVVNQDWSKLHQGQKVDPQAHIGQVMDESVKAYQEDMKSNSMKRVKELTDELNTEKRRINDFLKEKSAKEKEIQILHAQLDTIQHKQQPTQTHQPQNQTLQLQLQRITEENIHLNQQLTQQQQLIASNLVNNGDSSNVQVRVLSDQIKKLSVDNANLEKKANSNELLAKEAHKEKDDLIRYNEQLTQSLHTIQKDLQHNEEKLDKDSNETRTLYMNQINEYKRRIEQLESDNEQLRREDIVHVEPPSPPTTDIQTITLNTEEREQLEQEIQQLKQTKQHFEDKQREHDHLKQQLTQELEQHKHKYDDIQAKHQTHENELRQEIERLKQSKNIEQQQIDTLRAELNEVKAKHDSKSSQLEERLRQEHEKQRKVLTDLLPKDLRNQLSNDNQDFDQWISSYRQVVESNKHTLQEESASLKHENEQLHKNMNDVENQLKQIEQTVQSKEEILLAELKSKDTTLENVGNENEQLHHEMQRLRSEIERLQSANDASAHETRALKLQLDERFLVAANSPSVIADESFELVKQPSPSLSPIVIDIRADQLNELIRSSKEALENQDSLTQQLDRHLDDMHRGGTGETSTSNVDQSTESSSSHQQS